MSFFIKCISPSYVQGALYVVKASKPHKLNHPQSLDRDWFMDARKAAAAKRKLEATYANWPVKFHIERR